MALQTRPSPSWNASPDICIIFGFLHNPPPGSPDIFTIHLHHLGMSPRTSAPSRMSSQSTPSSPDIFTVHLHFLGMSPRTYAPSRMSSQSTPSSLDIFSAVFAIYLPAHIGAPTSTLHGTKSSNALVQFTWQWIPFHRYLWVWFRVQVPSFWRHLAVGVSPHISVLAY